MAGLPPVDPNALTAGRHTILAGYRGSVAHGMYIPHTDPNSVDDVDVMSVFVAAKGFYLGLSRNRRVETQESMKEAGGVMLDSVAYELQKFVSLLLKSNPNVLSLLWLRAEHYLVMTEAGQALIDHRDIFSSRRLVHDAFTGYARGQLKKMTAFSKEGYMGAKRKALVEKHGYDCKNAAHLIRLLKMGIEFLQTGRLKVFRDEDADVLLDIKTGKWLLQDVQRLADELFDATRRAFEESALPDRPDFDQAEALVMDILSTHLRRAEAQP